MIAGGRVYHGASGYAERFGHTSINFAGPLCECGNRGCLELYASSEALRATYAQASLSAGGDAPSASEILRRVRGGEAAARDAYRRVVGQLAFGVVGLINALNPGLQWCSPTDGGGRGTVPGNGGRACCART